MTDLVAITVDPGTKRDALDRIGADVVVARWSPNDAQPARHLVTCPPHLGGSA